MTERNIYIENKEALNDAINYAVEELKVSPTYNITTNDGLVTEFANYVSMYVKDSNNVKFNVHEVDVESGLLDISISQEISYFNNKKREISLRKVLFLDVN